MPRLDICLSQSQQISIRQTDALSISNIGGTPTAENPTQNIRNWNVGTLNQTTEVWKESVYFDEADYVASC